MMIIKDEILGPLAISGGRMKAQSKLLVFYSESLSLEIPRYIEEIPANFYQTGMPMILPGRASWIADRSSPKEKGLVK